MANILIIALAILAIVFLVLALADATRRMYFLVAAVVCAVLLVLVFVFLRGTPAAAVVTIPAATVFLVRAAYQLG